ncbi:MarR family transcriptional regulator [Halobacterium salinarum]|uniref:MarR family transcriptional regulator n=1 Tax=Halobacterium salinarum TaxID=2242 RepID=UPI0025551818|nr:MarR family transcriptional regulator [Halobacterium salinarum]MDL0126519.1 MarR family transcriptional regulator [Halobacterium salinarum]MDL0131908.1 MarR family transcriptional regulator [Halobacterium salinarum]MDL0132118.1 MarR family transcriptional regulator [Halobacterium salinarum]MDL0132489.1 MarR family transcriptional regulator [Halobacterium salinarum]MDL0143557.1 MarR family transcriptional regulator [Halobacterium salinarum]
MSGDAFPVKPETDEYTVLSFLVAHRGTEFTLDEIADHTNIRESSATEAVMQLRDGGLVTQSEDHYYVNQEEGQELPQRLESLDAVVRLFEATPADDGYAEQGWEDEVPSLK